MPDSAEYPGSIYQTPKGEEKNAREANFRKKIGLSHRRPLSPVSVVQIKKEEKGLLAGCRCDVSLSSLLIQVFLSFSLPFLSVSAGLPANTRKIQGENPNVSLIFILKKIVYP